MGSGFKDWAAGDVLTAADVDGYLMRQTVMTFADASARDTALSGVLDEGMTAYLEDTNEVTVYDGSDWIVYAGRGYSYVQTVYFTSSGTFTKATYPWLRAVRIRLVGGGGGGGGCEGTSNGDSTSVAKGGNGGGSGYAEAFVLESSLSSSETVTVGAGGSGGSSGNNAGSNGGTSSFGSHCVAGGGDGGGGGAQDTHPIVVANGTAGAGTTGDLLLEGNQGPPTLIMQSQIGFSYTGWSVFGNGQSTGIYRNTGASGKDYGGGGAGAASTGQNVARSGGTGGDGLVIVELYA